MIDVVSIKFKNHGKSYYFDPAGLDIPEGAKVIVETSKGLEIADCFRSVHAVEETAVIQPLRPVVRIATEDDLRVEAINRKCETDAFAICEQKIKHHGLDMKLVEVECSFDGSKTTFFFTSDGRVDFRELVKDLASVFRNRIELRQIGVRDEAKMLGGIGICGRPYCCHQFLDDFQPVSTKMAKVQSLSLNPTKISGSCGRLMCCLRYEQEAYEDLLKKVPKQGAFVETKDGYGTAVQVNLLRQTVKVKLDGESDDSVHLFKASEMKAVPGGRPKEGEPLPKVYFPVPGETEEDEDLNESEQNLMAEYSEPMRTATETERGSQKSHSDKKYKTGRKETKETTHVKVEKKVQPTQDKNKENASGDEEKSGNSAERKSHRSRNRRKQGKPQEKAELSRDQEHSQEQAHRSPKPQKKQPPKKEQAPAEKKTAAPDAKPENGDNVPKKKHNPNKKYYHHKKPHKAGEEQ